MYIDAEKLVPKIKELNLVTKTYEEQVAFYNALAMVVEIITSLQQEQPQGLDEAAEEYAYNNWEDNDYHTGASEGLPFDAIGHTEKCFKAGTEWMARQGDTREVEAKDDAPTSPDFDTEVYNWLKQHGSDETRQLIEMTARHFWEVAQNGGAMLHVADKSYEMGRRDERMEMMKDAVECEVYDFSSKEPHPHIYVNTPGLITGDKVKVIILKAEDEQ